MPPVFPQQSATVFAQVANQVSALHNAMGSSL
jgi:hypothetical protein